MDRRETVYEYLKIHIGNQADKVDIILDPNKELKLYHVSLNPNIKKFLPYLSNRTLLKETRSIPRTSCADNLLSCLGGGALTDLFVYIDKKQDGRQYIYRMDSTVYVRPNVKLLPDVKETDEWWVVYPSIEDTKNKPDKVGELFIYKQTTQRKKNYYYMENVIYLKTTIANFKILNNGNGTIELKQPGYYILTFISQDGQVFRYKPSDISVERITEKQYLKTLLNTLGLNG